MKKIKILFYSHTIDYGGTWRSHERILLNLNPDLFDVYVFYNPNQDNNRLDYLKTKLIKCRWVIIIVFTNSLSVINCFASFLAVSIKLSSGVSTLALN